MKKTSIVFLIAIAVGASFVGFASFSFAESKRPPAIVGVVKEINGTSLTLIARDNNTYTVDASDAKVVTGFFGFWAKPSLFSNIQVADTLTIKGDINGSSISATDIADNKTPKNAQSDARTNKTPSILDTVVNAINVGTSTSDISSSTPETASNTASSTDVTVNNEAITTTSATATTTKTGDTNSNDTLASTTDISN
jgi:hypothetical protein